MLNHHPYSTMRTFNRGNVTLLALDSFGKKVASWVRIVEKYKDKIEFIEEAKEALKKIHIASQEDFGNHITLFSAYVSINRGYIEYAILNQPEEALKQLASVVNADMALLVPENHEHPEMIQQIESFAQYLKMYSLYLSSSILFEHYKTPEPALIAIHQALRIAGKSKQDVNSKLLMTLLSTKGQIHFEQKNFQEAREALEAAVKLESQIENEVQPQAEVSWLKTMTHWFLGKNPSNALNKINMSLTRTFLARTYFQLKDFSSAERECLTILEHPAVKNDLEKTVVALRFFADEARVHDAYSIAIRFYDRLNHYYSTGQLVDNEQRQILIELINLSAHNKAWEKVHHYWEPLQVILRTQGAAIYEEMYVIATKYEENKEYFRAANFYQATLHFLPKEFEGDRFCFLKRIGDILLKLEKYEEAILTYREASSFYDTLNPLSQNNVEVYKDRHALKSTMQFQAPELSKLGIKYYKEKNYAMAETYCRLALMLYQDKVVRGTWPMIHELSIQRYLGDALRMQGKIEYAIEHYDHIIHWYQTEEKKGAFKKYAPVNKKTMDDFLLDVHMHRNEAVIKLPENDLRKQAYKQEIKKAGDDFNQAMEAINHMGEPETVKNNVQSPARLMVNVGIHAKFVQVLSYEANASLPMVNR